MKESCYEDNYPYTVYDRGDLIVVDDLYDSNFAYAEEIGEEERFEVRRHGLVLNRFKTLEDAKQFLQG